jgi:hypothetical protein
MDFERWFQQQGHPAAPMPTPEPDLPDGIREVVKLFPDGRGTYLARCRRCERDYEMELDSLDDFDSYYNLCGGSPSCLP